MDSTIRGASKELKKLPSATTSVIYFLVMSIMYGFIMIYTTFSSETLSKVSTNSSNQIYTLIYIIFLISGTYFINVGISKSICNENTIQWGTVFTLTLLPWIIIFGLLYFLLELFPGWINPFSNTIGYIIVNALGSTTTLQQVLKLSSEEKNTTLKKALENIEKNYSRFINEIDTNQEKFERFIRQLSNESFIKTIGDNTDNKEQLYNDPKVVQLFALVKIKELIGKLFWYILAGTLIASISYNFLINMTCEKTLDQSKKEYSELYKNSANPVYGKKWLKLSEEPTEADNQDYTGRLSEFITKFGNHLLTTQDSNNEVSLENHQLRSIQLSFEELPTNCFIQIDNSYFRPIE